MSFNPEMLNTANSWPFVEAKRVLKRISKVPDKKEFICFQTGYGPSGLPHIGTFGEVARTSMMVERWAWVRWWMFGSIARRRALALASQQLAAAIAAARRVYTEAGIMDAFLLVWSGPERRRHHQFLS